MDDAVATQDLTKTYRRAFGRGEFTAVHELSLHIPRGQIFGFLGPNGAGKTTTINMLLGNIYPTSGEARLLGRPARDREARRKVGFLPEKFQFHEFLTAEEFLDLNGKLYGMEPQHRRVRIAETLEMVGLADRRKSKIREYSKGMQQRVGLAQAILNDPDLVILDEPTSALDPMGRREVREIISRLKEQGKTVMLNSHLLSEIEMTCDQVAILKAGQIIRQGKIDSLLAAPSVAEMRILDQSPGLLRDLESLAHSITVDGETVTAALPSEEIIPALAEAIVKNGGKLMSLIPRRESLEDLFVRVMEGSST